jgi:hypothetical protein
MRQISYIGFSSKMKRNWPDPLISRSATLYIDNVFLLNNSRLGDFVDHIYPIEFEKKNTTDTDRSG